MARGSSEGLAGSRQLQQTTKALPMQLLEIESPGQRELACGDHRSPRIGATAKGLPDRASARLRVRGGGVEWCVASNQGRERYI